MLEDEIDIGNYERSLVTPDQHSSVQELMSPESQGFEEVSRVAATLYIEMKKSIKSRNLQDF